MPPSALHRERETITQRVLSRRTKRSPKLLQWRLECLAHSIIEGLAGMLPGPWVFRLGGFLGTLAWHIMPMRRKIVLRNLRIACAGEKDLPEIRRMAKATFRRSGANLVSAAHTARLTPQKLAQVIHIENLELLEKSLATGKGVVLLLAHMGNWEILSRIVHLFPPGSKTGAFYRPLNNPLLDERILRRRKADGARMFSKRDPFHEVTKFLRDGGIVGILADQRVGMQGEVVSFFGRLTRTSPLPSLLARRAKSEVLALSLSTESPGKWKAVFLPVATPPTTANCMSALENSMQSGLMDIFWLQDRWKLYVSPNRSISQWLDDPDTTGQKPHRLLWCLPHGMNLQDIPETWRHPDAGHEMLPAETIKGLGPAALIKRISELEDAGPLPIDCLIVSGNVPTGHIENACKKLAIRFVRINPTQP